MPKFYAIKQGRKKGIFSSWTEVQPLVTGYSDAKFKSFPTLAQAQDYLEGEKEDASSNKLPHSPGESSQRNPDLIVYTDGSCLSRVGGYGVLFLQEGKIIQTLSGLVPISAHSEQSRRHSSSPCTNQKAELYAILVAVKQINQPALFSQLTFSQQICSQGRDFPPLVGKSSFSQQICSQGRDFPPLVGKSLIRTDSEYAIKALTQWIRIWLQNGWKTSKGTPVENRELIQEIYSLLQEKEIRFEHVRSHQGEIYNEMVDRLANQGRLEYIDS